MYESKIPNERWLIDRSTCIAIYTHVDMRRLAIVSTGWNKASSDTPATADPMILASVFALPDEDMGLVDTTPWVDDDGRSSFGVILFCDDQCLVDKWKEPLANRLNNRKVSLWAKLSRYLFHQPNYWWHQPEILFFDMRCQWREVLWEPHKIKGTRYSSPRHWYLGLIVHS